jgi:ferric-dicitrate binding protein FerR (iron transport regulator)
MHTNEQMDELLIKQLLNESSAGENRLVDEWRAENNDNEKYYLDFKTIWESSKNLQSQYTIDENQAWKRFQGRVQQSQEDKTTTTIPFESKPKRLVWMKAAAAILIIATGLFALNNIFGNKQILVASNNEVLIQTLPDGSVITLNKHSSLAYSKDFNELTRDVELTGEAFFSVAPNKQKPFEIKVGAVKVKVVGTSFNIKETTLQTEVIVETGIVKVKVAGDSIKLLPKEKVVVDKKSAKLDVTKSDDLLYNYYRTKTFECINTPLFELIDALNKTYDTQIIIANENTKNLPYTTTFKDMPLNDILKVITQTFNLTIEQRDGKIILK